MFNQLVALGWGIVTFSIVIGVGTAVLTKFGGTQAICTMAACGAGGVYNESTNVCSNATSSSCAATPLGTAYTSINYLNTQLGSTGLAGWAPAIIAFAVGLLFLGAFMIGKGGGRRY